MDGQKIVRSDKSAKILANFITKISIFGWKSSKILKLALFQAKNANFSTKFCKNLSIFVPWCYKDGLL